MNCYDCTGGPEEDVSDAPVTLCPKHASVDRLIEALGELMQVAFDGPKHPVSSTMTQSWKRDIENRARALLDELKQPEGTQILETK